MTIDLNLSVVAGAKARVFGPIGMEQLWNRGGATGGKGSARGTPENGLNYRQTVATGWHRLLVGSHGKEGVNGSGPFEGFRVSAAFSRLGCCGGRGVGWEVS